MEDTIQDYKQSIKEAEKNFFIYLSIIAFSLVTLYSITDKQLILKEFTVHLPLLDIGVPLIFFFILGPVLLIVTYMNFILNYLSSKEKYINLADQNSDKVMDDFSFIFVFKQKKNIKFKKVQEFSLCLAIWLSFPVIILFYSLKYVKTHRPFGIVLFGILIFISLISTAYLIYYNFIKNKDKVKSRENSFMISLLTIIFSFSFIFYYTYFVINGLNGNQVYFFIFENMGYSNVVNLSYTNLVQEKNDDVNYWGRYQDLRLQGANLEGANLKKIIFEKVNFKNANFMHANLDDAAFILSDFEDAVFNDTILRNVEFNYDYDKLKKNQNITSLQCANFSESTIISCKFTKTVLTKSNFKKVKIFYSNFSKSYLVGCNFDEAEIYNTDFSESAHIGSSYKQAGIYSSGYIKTKLQACDFTMSKLISLNFKNADFDFANFTDSSINNEIEIYTYNNKLNKYNKDLDMTSDELTTYNGNSNISEGINLNIYFDKNENLSLENYFTGNNFQNGQKPIFKILEFNNSTPDETWSMAKDRILTDILGMNLNSFNSKEINYLFSGKLPDYFNEEKKQKENEKQKQSLF